MKKSTVSAFFAIAVVLMAGKLQLASGAVLYQSAEMGTPEQGSTSGLIVASTQFVGVKFQVLSPVNTAALGGHFLEVPGYGNGKIFGAFVALTGPGDFPDSADLSTPDVLGVILLSPPTDKSALITAPLSLALNPGWYAMIFGAGLFGATGNARAPGEFTGDTNIGSPLYFHSNSQIYVDDGNSLSNEFLVTAIPEPSSLALAAIGLAGLAACACLRRR